MRTVFAFLIATLIGLGSAFAQERSAGAGRVEVGAFPGGVIVFGQNADENGFNFGDYALGASFTVNLNRWVGFEGEIGGGIGYRQKVTFNAVTLVDQKTPHMLAYNGNLVVHVVGKDRVVVPYVTGGVGALTLFSAPEVENLGITTDETYLTGNLGGGVKWFPMAHVGVRGDGRFIIVKNKDVAPLFGQQDNRYGFRVYGGIVLTY
jgi:Outer membrane protein beta-barrel domain